MTADYYLVTDENIAGVPSSMIIHTPADANIFMADWLNTLYIEDRTICLELQPGDCTRYCLSITAITSGLKSYALWHHTLQDKVLCLPNKILSPHELRKYTMPEGAWHPVTLAVVAELHRTWCEHALQGREIVIEQYEPVFYNWLTHKPMLEGRIENGQEQE